MEQDRHRLQRRILQPREDFIQLKLQISFLIPFIAVDQGNLVNPDQEKETRRFRLGKQYLCCQFLSLYLP